MRNYQSRNWGLTGDKEYAGDNHLPWPGDRSIVQLHCFSGYMYIIM